jgi:hypothetical protein
MGMDAMVEATLAAAALEPAPVATEHAR